MCEVKEELILETKPTQKLQKKRLTLCTLISMYKESLAERKVITLILQSRASCTKIDNVLAFAVRVNTHTYRNLLVLN